MSSPPSCSIASAMKPRSDSLSPASTALPHTVPRAGELVDGGVDAVGVAGADRDRRALVEQRLGDRSADALGRAGDEGALAGEAEIHGCSFDGGRPMLLVLHSRNPTPKPSPRHIAHMTTESINDFREQARAWLESQAPRRTAEAPQAWGEGEFSVVVFHDATDDEERELLARYREWHHRKVAAGFGAIAVPAGVRRARAHAGARRGVQGGRGRVRRPARSRDHLGHQQVGRADDRGVRLARAARAVVPPVLPARRALLPAVLRAGRRQRSRRARLPGGTRRRRVGARRSEGVDVDGADRPVRLRDLPHRPRRAQARRL